jgi:TnpA family transposase
MAEASQGVTPDQLVWTKSAYIRPETYKAALARIINAHHVLPIAAVWGQGTSSSSDGQFFRSGKRGSGAGDFNARYHAPRDSGEPERRSFIQLINPPRSKNSTCRGDM